MLSMQEARDTLRVDGNYNDAIISPLLSAMPDYVETLTGVPSSCISTDQEPELVKTLEKFVLTLWYNPDGTDADRLTKVIDSLTATIKAAYYNQYRVY